MQISICQIRHSNDLYYISVNLSHIQKIFFTKICIFEDFVVILQRETFDTNHSSAGKCIFCRTGEAREAAEQRFAVLLPNG